MSDLVKNIFFCLHNLVLSIFKDVFDQEVGTF